MLVDPGLHHDVLDVREFAVHQYTLGQGAIELGGHGIGLDCLTRAKILTGYDCPFGNAVGITAPELPKDL